MKKLKIREVLESDISIGERYLDKVVEELTEYLKKYTDEGYTGISIDQDCYSYGGETNIIGYREETDDELAKRIATEEYFKEKTKKEKEKKEKSERDLYLKLKKKYDKGN